MRSKSDKTVFGLHHHDPLELYILTKMFSDSCCPAWLDVYVAYVTEEPHVLMKWPEWLVATVLDSVGLRGWVASEVYFSRAGGQCQCTVTRVKVNTLEP